MTDIDAATTCAVNWSLITYSFVLLSCYELKRSYVAFVNMQSLVKDVLKILLILDFTCGFKTYDDFIMLKMGQDIG